jgi:transcriptional regulator with GAF, ATPase, and Fis domain
MTDQQLLVETLVELADTLVDDYDVIDFMQTLAERSVALLDVSAAGIMLSNATGHLSHAACSSEQMRLVELFELQLEEGPCFDAFRTQTAVRASTAAETARRWPRFAEHARAGGFVAVSAVPLRLRDSAVGALNLFSNGDDALNDDELRIVQAMADIATIGILQERLARDQNILTTQLEAALQSRVVIEQAKGVVAERNQIDVDDAFRHIRTYSRSSNRRLGDVAREIIDGRSDFLVPEPRSS